MVFNAHTLKPRRQLLRVESTQAEKMLWERLRKNNLGCKFLRQYSIEGYVVDFYCPQKRLCIEVEGGIHKLTSSQMYDKYRFRFIEGYNIKIIKFTNREIFLNIRNVVENIKSSLNTPS